ncbi:PKD domain-containing protein [Candidatus Woesearchaeota archaeon]|nr:PKD domain-containing protein [Candidatus Woesearchaeota archaeon]
MNKKLGLVGKKGNLFFLAFAFFILALSLVLAEELQSGTGTATTGQITITATPESGNAPLTVQFSASPTDESTTLETYSWDFQSDGTADSTEANPTLTFTESGTFTITLTATGKDTANTEKTFTASKEVMVQSPIALSVTANPTTGQAPLTIQFTLAATGKNPLKYSWDFNWDKKPDSTEQNPLFTYTAASEYKATVTVTDAEGNTAIASIPISVTKYDSHLNLSSYFPDTVNPGENSITLLVVNEGTEPVKDITAKLVGKSIQHLTSTSIALLQPGDQDSLTIKANFLKEGELTATAKILDKNFPLNFIVTKGTTYNKEELQVKFDELKKQLQEQETIYYDKKSQNYLVAEVLDNMKSIQKQMQEVQQQLLTNKLPEAKVGLELTGGAITDLAVDLTQVRKPEVTLLMWMKENAVAITAIIASLGALGGILVKVKQHAVKVKDHAQKFVQEGKQKISEKIEEGKKKKNEKGKKESHEEGKKGEETEEGKEKKENEENL